MYTLSMKVLSIILAFFIFIVAGGIFIYVGGIHASLPLSGPSSLSLVHVAPSEGYLDTTYFIDGVSTKVAAATSTDPAAHVRYFGDEVEGDINGDSFPDVAFLITDQPGGSGTFYYVVAALLSPDGHYHGTDAYLLGDRIAPQTLSITDGKILVTYADRKPSDPMIAQPSVGVSKTLIVKGNSLIAQ
jgi:hypothetical protein